MTTMEPRTEDALHAAFWEVMQRATNNAEFAITGARDAIYMLIGALDDPSMADGARCYARSWLDRNGHDKRLESRIPSMTEGGES